MRINLNSDKNQRRQEEPFFSQEFPNDEKESSVMISDNQTKQSVISSLQEQIDRLEQEKKSLEIDNVCLQQQNHELKNRIDDVANHFPKTSILLGKNPEKQKTKKRLKIKFKK